MVSTLPTSTLHISTLHTWYFITSYFSACGDSPRYDAYREGSLQGVDIEALLDAALRVDRRQQEQEQRRGDREGSGGSGGRRGTAGEALAARRAASEEMGKMISATLPDGDYEFRARVDAWTGCGGKRGAEAARLMAQDPHYTAAI